MVNSFAELCDSQGAIQGFKKAALVLHGLNAADRAWALAALAPADRVRLQTELGELDDLGIPPQPGLLDELLGRREAGLLASARATVLVDRIDCVEPEHFVLLLERESFELGLALLRLYPWGWTSQALGRVAGARRGQFVDGLRASPPPARSRRAGATLRPVELALLERLAEQLAQDVPQAGLDEPSGAAQPERLDARVRRELGATWRRMTARTAALPTRVEPDA